MMIYSVMMIVLLGLFLWLEVIITRKNIEKLRAKKERLLTRYGALKREDHALKENVYSLEKRMSRYFFFYDVTKRIAPYLNRQDLLMSFTEELRYLGEIDNVKISAVSPGEECMCYTIIEGEPEKLFIRTEADDVVEYIPYFIQLLRLCIERVSLYERLQQLSIYDPLTNVYNRRYFMQRFFEEIERAKEFNLRVSLLMIDIDHFKGINDIYGHLGGDIVLSKVAELIKNSIRGIDCLGRFGGEEFAILLLDTDRVGAIMVGERICNTVAQAQLELFEDRIATTVSIGVAAYPHNAVYPNMIIEVADRALYKAKMTGKNRVCWC